LTLGHENGWCGLPLAAPQRPAHVHHGDPGCSFHLFGRRRDRHASGKMVASIHPA